MKLRNADLINITVVALSGIVVFLIAHSTGHLLLEATVAVVYLVLLVWQVRRAMCRSVAPAADGGRDGVERPGG